MLALFRSGRRETVQRVGAGVAVLSGAALLLIRRRDNGLWDLPGGATGPGERVEDAALRECHEETGLDLRGAGVTLLAVFSGPAHQHTYPDGNTVHWVTVLYLARTEALDVRAGDDAAEACWWPLDALPTSVAPATRAYFRAVQSAVAGSVRA